jgi:hypothetical protein
MWLGNHSANLRLDIIMGLPKSIELMKGIAGNDLCSYG